MIKHTLPNKFLEKIGNEKITLSDYCITIPNFKNKITLSQNVFSFLIEGQKELVHFDMHTSINNQQFSLIKAGRCLMTEILSLNNHYRSFLLFFDDDILFNFIEKNKIKLKSNLETKSFCVFDYDEYIRLFVDSLIKLNSQNTIIKTQLLPTKFEELFLYLINKYGIDFLSNFLTSQDNYKNHFTTVIETNILSNLTIEELSFLCNKSPSTFKREFQKIYNESPIRWFQEKRLEHSAFLLQHKKLRPSDIYEEVGYENLSSFIHAYKKKFGVTPKKHFQKNVDF